MRKKIFLLLVIMLSLYINTTVVMADCIGNECYNNYDKNAVASCGEGLIKNIPSLIPKVISIGYTIIQVRVPIILVVIGSIDLLKRITAQKEDEIKKGQNLFIKRLIVAAIIFFVFIIVKFVISVVADSNSSKIIDCAECFIKEDCD